MKLNNLYEMSDTQNFEIAICNAWQGLTPKRITDSNQSLALGITNVLRKMPGTPKGKSAEHIGSGDFPITSEYAKWGGVDKTPKTDVILGDHKISIKKWPNSQLLSGAKGDAQAVVMSVLERNAKKQKIAEEVAGIFERFVVRGVTKSGTIEQSIEKGKDKKIVEADAMHKEVSTLLNERFSSNKKVYAEIIKEAISGRIKFGASSKGSADYVMTYSTGGDVTYHSIDDSAYLNKLAGKAKIRLKFKSTPLKRSKGKQYTYNSVLGIMLTRMHEYKELSYRRNVLKESIGESVLDSIWDKLKSLVNSVIQYLKGSLYNVLSFFELSPDIEYDNSIDFS